jgi:hypothetical protein
VPQVKSSYYYIFWGLATAAVVAGQIYVGTGYRGMSRSINRLLSDITLELNREFQLDYLNPPPFPPRF